MPVFEVTVTSFGYVVAKDLEGVSQYVRELCDSEGYETNIKEITRLEDLVWDRGALPYGDNAKELTLEELLTAAVKLKISVPAWAEEEVRELLAKKGVKIE